MDIPWIRNRTRNRKRRIDLDWIVSLWCVFVLLSEKKSFRLAILQTTDRSSHGLKYTSAISELGCTTTSIEKPIYAVRVYLGAGRSSIVLKHYVSQFVCER